MTINALVSSPESTIDNSVQPLPFPSAAFISDHGDGQSFSMFGVLGFLLSSFLWVGWVSM